MVVTVLHGNSEEVLKQYPDNTFDEVATDPNYGIYFCNREWDIDVPAVELWKEVLRTMKYGAFAFIMSSPRQDVYLENLQRLKEAGFLIGFPSVQWCFASGFPKAVNVSKLIDKHLGAKRKKEHSPYAPRQEQRATVGLSKIMEKVPSSVLEARERGYFEKDSDAPASEVAQQFQGAYLNFQPKPANEVIIVVMKPYPPIHRSDLWQAQHVNYYRTVWKIFDFPYDAAHKKVYQKWEKKLGCHLQQGDEVYYDIAINPNCRDHISHITPYHTIIIDNTPYKDTEITNAVTAAMVYGKSITWMDEVRIPTLNPDQVMDSHGHMRDPADIEEVTIKGIPPFFTGVKVNRKQTQKRNRTTSPYMTSHLQAGDNAWGPSNAYNILTHRNRFHDNNPFGGFGNADHPFLYEEDPCGRFPGTLLISDHILDGGHVAGHAGGNKINKVVKNGTGYAFGGHTTIRDNHAPAMTFSAYFSLDAWWQQLLNHLPPEMKDTFPFLIVPKPQKKEKEKGLESFLKKKKPVLSGATRPVSLDAATNDGNRQNQSTETPNDHPTVKPVALFTYLIKWGSKKGDHVLDPFSGSGTTGIAGVLTDRDCTLIDQDEHFVEIAKARVAAWVTPIPPKPKLTMLDKLASKTETQVGEVSE